MKIKLDMKTKRGIVDQYKKEYRKKSTNKLRRGEILDKICELTSLNRKYASTCLSGSVKLLKNKDKKKKRNVTTYYDSEVKKHLKKVWELSNQTCGKLLISQIPVFLPFYEQKYELLSEKLHSKLLSISPATIDRLLSSEKKGLFAKRTFSPNNSSLKTLVPIRTHDEWNMREVPVGHVQIDLVHHCNGDVSGDYIHTLEMVDYQTGWSQSKACINRAQIHVHAALQESMTDFPFELVHIHYDNSSEFLNDQMLRFCKHKNIEYSRSRSYKKGDNFFVENRNRHLIRKNIGYMRYEGEVDLFLLNELHKIFNLYTNFFLPQRRCIKKIKVNKRMKKSYDKARTPFVRVMEQKDVSKEVKQAILKQYKNMNPITLKIKLIALQNILILNKEARQKRAIQYAKSNNLKINFG